MKTRRLCLSVTITALILALSMMVGAESACASFLVVTLKDGSSAVYNVPVESDEIDSATLAFSDDNLHEVEGRSNLVAIVNDEPITAGAFYTELSNVVGRQVLSYIIDESLVRQEAKRSGIEVTEAEVEREFEKIREATGSEFEAFLAQYGLTEQGLRVNLAMSLLVFKVSTKDIQVSDEEIDEYYDSHKQNYSIPERVRASHILVETQEDAEKVIELLEAGTDFAELARERSIDTYSAQAGGDLGYFARGVMIPEFEEAAFSTEVGGTSGIVKSQFGYHILQVTGRADAEFIPLEDARESIERSIKGEHALDFKQLVAELRRQSDIMVFDSRFTDLGTVAMP